MHLHDLSLIVSCRGSFSTNQDRTYLGIVGMELPPALSRMMETGFVEWSVSQAQAEAIEAALSYIASIVSLCSLYLDVPLRYPIHLLGSRSIITKSPSSRLSSSAAREWPIVHQEFPLFFQGSGRFSKKRLATAFCLLAKDIHQLLSSHGLKSTDTTSLLENLDALVAASRSGVPSRSHAY